MLSTNTKISSMVSSRQSEAPRNLAQGRRGMSVGCDEENFSFPEESLFTRALCEISRFARNGRDVLDNSYIISTIYFFSLFKDS